MGYLLDTHVLIWMMEGDTRLSQQAREIILDENNELKISVVSYWEMSIKRSLGKLQLKHATPIFWNEAQNQGIEILDIKIDHLTALESLNFIHRDPFDRLLIAQSIVEDLTVITVDEVFQKYPIKSVWN